MLKLVRVSSSSQYWKVAHKKLTSWVPYVGWHMGPIWEYSGLQLAQNFLRCTYLSHIRPTSCAIWVSRFHTSTHNWVSSIGDKLGDDVRAAAGYDWLATRDKSSVHSFPAAAEFIGGVDDTICVGQNMVLMLRKYIWGLCWWQIVYTC